MAYPCKIAIIPRKGHIFLSHASHAGRGGKCPAISQHLRVLKQAKLVVDRPVGTHRLYQLNPEGFDAIRAYCDRFWTQALAAFEEKVEQPIVEG